ncbi:hypothetical protein [Natrarchaeobius chitinivorans]|uniref:DUF7993 domain-containing protein n=1 Tax=Natrarchaeobius chitinivorans TaxID=1679083 RepID=A0A3N6PBA7_NATCH|nr:hypothetical protein [Natrarchaeobius chitinivorans]RQG93815.1 hypothetical protein EA473_13940 [Natrarchaeobius chitinivorans]
MVEKRITDGKRIAQLLASELEGRDDGELESVAVANADRDVEPTAGGARAYDVTRGTPSGSDERIARVFVHEDHARLEFSVEPAVAAEAAADVDLRVRSNEGETSRTSVLLESGAAVKRATDVVQAVVRTHE